MSIGSACVANAVSDTLWLGTGMTLLCRVDSSAAAAVSGTDQRCSSRLQQADATTGAANPPGSNHHHVADKTIQKAM